MKLLEAGWPNLVEPPLTATGSLQRPLYFVSADSPYCLLLFKPLCNGTATKACPQLPKWPLDNGQFFPRLMKKSRMVIKFDTYGTLMINLSTIVHWLCSIFAAAVAIKRHKLSTDTYSECCEPCSLCHVNILIQNIMQAVLCILLLYVIYAWITIIYSKHELSTINMFYSPKINCHITSLPPHKGHFLMSPRWPLWIGSTLHATTDNTIKKKHRSLGVSCIL